MTVRFGNIRGDLDTGSLRDAQGIRQAQLEQAGETTILREASLKRNREMGQELGCTGGRAGSNRKVLGPLCLPKGVVQQRQRRRLYPGERRGGYSGEIPTRQERKGP